MNKPQHPEIPLNEFQLRTTTARRFMEEEGIDALLLLNNPNQTYFLGYRKPLALQWLHAGVLTRNGQCGLVVPQIYHEVARQTTWLDDENIRAFGGASHWGLPQDPIEVVLDMLRGWGLAEKRIGVEIGGPAYTYVSAAVSEFDAIRAGLPKVTFVNAMPMIWRQRMVKTEWEIEIMRRLCQITVKGIKRGLETVEEGMSERELLRIFWETAISEGAFDCPLEGDMVFRGGVKDYAMSIGRPVDAKLTKGRQLFFDGGASLKGYHSDMQRQFCIGKPPDLQRRLVDISERGQQVAEKMLQPRNKVSDVYHAGMAVIKKVPDDLKGEIRALYSHTFMGHSQGLNYHEPPWIVAEDQTVMVPGMIFSLEIPALDIPQFRVLLEDFPRISTS